MKRVMVSLKKKIVYRLTKGKGIDLSPVVFDGDFIEEKDETKGVVAPAGERGHGGFHPWTPFMNIWSKPARGLREQLLVFLILSFLSLIRAGRAGSPGAGVRTASCSGGSYLERGEYW